MSTRYLQRASEDELLERAATILRNTLAMLDYYNFEGLRADLGDEPWVCALTELRAEFSLRGLEFPPSRGFVRAARWISRASPALGAAFAAARSYECPPRPFMVRYLKQTYARDLAFEGRLRLTPASRYRLSSNNAARYDDENLRWLQHGPLRVHLVHALSGRERSFVQNMTYGAATETDYYVLSLSRVLSPFLFSAFGVDACVIIRKPQEFLSRLEAALAEALQGRWGLALRSVDYRDPWVPPAVGEAAPTTDDLFFVKDYGYSYQQEERVAIIPQDCVNQALVPITVRLGEPRTFLDLLVLPGAGA
jgi:hypothetical protein